jgi:hypothetical protein
MSRLDEVAEQLALLNLQIKHDMEQAEGKAEHVNLLVSELGSTGLLTRQTLLGPTFTAPYEAGLGPSDSAQVVQAALSVPRGFGVCRWEMDEFLQLQSSPAFANQFESRARILFEPFEACTPAEKKFLLPFLEEMLEDLTDIALVAASRLERDPIIPADDYFANRDSSIDRKPGE